MCHNLSFQGRQGGKIMRKGEFRPDRMEKVWKVREYVTFYCATRDEKEG